MASATIPVGPTVVQVYFPPAYANPTPVITNAGTATVYVGQAAVSAHTGLPLPAGQTLSFPLLTTALYAVSAVTTTGSGTTTAGALPPGSSAVDVTALTGLSVGAIVKVGTTSAETFTITATSTAPTVTFSTKAGQYHPAGANIVPATAWAGSCVTTEKV